MDIILINDEKLKVILTKSDMDNMHINIETLDYTSVSSKKVFWEILEQAKNKAGFNADKCKLYVQVFPDKKGGCEMFVTKISGENESEQGGRKNKIYRVSASKTENKASGIYIILGFDQLYSLCKRIFKNNIFIASDLYYDEHGKYILTLKIDSKLPSYISQKAGKLFRLPEYLSEYGKVEKFDDNFLLYVNEYCKKIAEGNAVELISNL